MSEKISILIPAYNAEKTLAECLGSALAQTLPAHEILVVDNNSTDQTKKIIEEFQKQSPAVRSIFEPQRGRASARNAGIRSATGDIIAMTDADCVLPPTWLAELTQPILAEHEVATLGFEADAWGKAANYWTRQTQKADEEYFTSKMTGDYINHIDTKNFAIRADLIKKNLFNTTLTACEDWELFLRLRKNSKIRYLPDTRVLHYHPASWRAVFHTRADRARAIQTILKLHPEPSTEHMSLLQRITNFLANTLRNPTRLPFELVAAAGTNAPTLFSK